MSLESPERLNAGERGDFFDTLLVVCDFISRGALLPEPKDPATSLEQAISHG